MSDPGCAASVLSEFRQRLITGQAELLRFETRLTLGRAQGLRKAQGRQRTDSTHVLAAIPHPQSPRGRRRHAPPCAERAGHRRASVAAILGTCGVVRAFEPAVGGRAPAAGAARPLGAGRATLARTAPHVLWAIYAPATPAGRRERPAIQSLRQVWLPPCYGPPEGPPGRWRSAEELPPAPLLLRSPYAPAAR